MRRTDLLLNMAVLLSAFLAAPFAAADSLTLAVGAQRTIELPAPVARIVIAEPGVVNASVLDDRRVQLTGLLGGHTNVTIFTANNSNDGVSYSVNVGSGRRGDGGNAGDGLTRALQADPDLKGISTHRHGEDVVIIGNVPSLESHVRAAALAKTYNGKGEVEDLVNVTGNQMVAVEVKFAAVSVTTLQDLGFNFQQLGGSIQGAVAAPNSTAGGYTVGPAPGLNGSSNQPIAGLPLQSAFNLLLNSSKHNSFAALSILQGTGLVQFLAEPTLLVRSGEHADFLAGGDVPIPVPQGGSAAGAITIEYHSYGVRLDIAPVVLSDHRIALRVAPEVSQIDTANSLSYEGFTVPAFLRRSTSTMVELADGQSFVLAGLIYSNNAFNENKVPWLSDIPILGDFFKITQNSRERQELIIIATPHLVHPLDPKAIPPLPGEAVSTYNPTIGDALLNAKPLDRAVADYGLIR
jgi:pilus assembly protein CpaC